MDLMSHIEFTGVAGVGKSTLRNRLMARNDDIYGGLHSTRPMRISPSLLQLIFRFSPNTVEEKMEKVYWRLTSVWLYNKFTRYHPKYGTVIEDCVGITRKNNENLDKRLRDTAQKYQYGIDSKRDGEILCLDEGFYHRGASVGVRTGCYENIDHYQLPPDEYFNVIPQPEMLFHITANTDIIQKRKRERDGESYPIGQLEKIRDLINRLCEEADKSGVRVIEITNNGTIDASIKQMENHI